MIKQVGIAIFAMLIIVLVGNPVMAQQVQVYSDPVRFDILAKAPAIPIPDSQRAFPGTSCGSGDRGPTGSGPSVQIPFGLNSVTIMGGNGSNLCTFDGGTMIFSANGGLDNTQPNFMTANTIVQDTHVRYGPFGTGGQRAFRAKCTVPYGSAGGCARCARIKFSPLHRHQTNPPLSTPHFDHFFRLQLGCGFGP